MLLPYISPVDFLQPMLPLTLVQVAQQMRENISTSMFLVMKMKMEQHLAYFKRP
jgi:hypothetical protein